MKEDYDWFCRLPLAERKHVQDELWATLGIERGLILFDRCAYVGYWAVLGLR